MWQDLYDHMEWADAIVWRAVLGSSAAKDDKRIADLLLHLHMTQRAFLAIWRKQELKFPDRASMTVEQIAQYGREYHQQVAPCLETLDTTTLDDEMVMPWAKRFRADAAATRMRDTLLQVPMHSTYHRGQVNARLRELGAEPPLTDYIAWIWIGRPRAEW